MENCSLRDLGAGTVTAFNSLLQTPGSAVNHINLNRVEREAQRFQVWAHHLGLYQDGHASLDYRVRDADLVRTRIRELLLGLQDHLENLVAIANGKRAPAEDTQDSTDLVSSSESSSGSSSDSSYVETEGSSSEGNFDEAAFRLGCLAEHLDTLYSIATLIRNPQNRPRKGVDQLYGNIAPADRQSYQKGREEVETLTVAYLHRQNLQKHLDSQEGDHARLNQEEILAHFASAHNWILRRTGTANAKRKQQFVYWKNHASKLEATRPEPAKVQTQLPIQTPDTRGSQSGLPHETTLQHAGRSLATSATPFPANMIKPEDMKSVISHHTSASAMKDLEEDELPWPEPPRLRSDERFFQCPYCKILCPAKYVKGNSWKTHIINDLQPYHCTYELCQDPHRTYGTRQEWIEHEDQHTRVWHCWEHSLEFETQPDFLSHLSVVHSGESYERLSDQVVSTKIAPSEHIHRDCPYCPTAFTDTWQMRRHIVHHLERFALLALPSIDDEADELEESTPSGNSHRVRLRGRADSVFRDFPGNCAFHP
ncbi:hypothetical protein PG985_009580 [Apiospora marii]|uniref:C2H2-type domain-containing protein n=1 Tax=Apiospora marii TaxID=335849 RepID=A0ABR1RGW9_9PEZI